VAPGDYTRAHAERKARRSADLDREASPVLDLATSGVYLLPYHHPAELANWVTMLDHVGGLSQRSETLKIAGERGFIPMSLDLNASFIKTHWEAVEEGAARTGRTPNRVEWRVFREVFVAETDEDAWRLSVGSMMGRQMREYLLPLLASFGLIEFLKHDPDVPDDDVTPEYCAAHNWLVGSPATVAEKLERLHDELGGFGVLLVYCFDYVENPEAWQTSVRLLAEEVLPRVAHLTPGAAVPA
jgi:alkanesulfonate monooxygenase SsuD/methylene tetrahydromethanopterin reductase-like flavin-dependent oxidoreductase (luciferase family)